MPLVLRDGAPVAVVIVLLLTYGGWTMMVRWDRNLKSCLASYDGARTAVDSARVDDTPLSGGGLTMCRKYRVDGTLDRHRAAQARRAHARHPLHPRSEPAPHAAREAFSEPIPQPEVLRDYEHVLPGAGVIPLIEIILLCNPLPLHIVDRTPDLTARSQPLGSSPHTRAKETPDAEAR